MKLSEKYHLILDRVNVTPLQARFLMIGGVNTLIGYLVVTCIYTLFSERLSFLMIGIISNIVAITMTFTLQKLFVFRTQGNWLQEYLRSYITYGAVGIIGFALLWIFLNVLQINVWISQAIIIVIITGISFIGHKKITFRHTQ
jgi:putative flippase GtrA